MKNDRICAECGKTHHLPTYDNICQFCQRGKTENEMTETIGHVTQCLECKKNRSERNL